MRLLMSVMVLVLLSVNAMAGDLEDAKAAFEQRNYVVALRLFQPLAEQGDGRAQSALGLIYENGLGVPQDYAEAVIWYRKAAEQNGSYAQYRLGFMYQNGFGVLKDYVFAHMWLNLAAAHGSEDAKYLRDTLASQEMSPEQIAEAQQLAREWKPTK